MICTDYRTIITLLTISILLTLSDESAKRKRGVHEVERRVATMALTDGAAVFFPDKEARRKQLFSMMSSSDQRSEGMLEVHLSYSLRNGLLPQKCGHHF